MSLIKNVLVVWTSSVLLSACAHHQEFVNSKLDLWLGSHPDKLVEAWGAPDSSYTMENGTRVLSYTTERIQSRYSGLAVSPYRFGNYTYSESCQMSFYTDPEKKTISRYMAPGDDNACVEAIREFSEQK